VADQSDKSANLAVINDGQHIVEQKRPGDAVGVGERAGDHEDRAQDEQAQTTSSGKNSVSDVS